jgi:hypothetical protein
VQPRSTPEAAGLPLTIVKSPKAIWREWAESLAEKAIPALQNHIDSLSWLAKRGISAATADRFGLGWLGHDRKVKRAAIGLQPKDGKAELWVPGGLLVATWDDNTIHRIRIRRTDADRARFLPDLKYYWIDGSGTEPIIIRPLGKVRGVVIVEAELDAYAVAAAHDQVMVIALGTVGAGLPAAIRVEIAASPTILVALDVDPDINGQTGSGAGPVAVKRWLSTFRQARFWPVPVGKDPGHYAELGGDLSTWVEAGLAPDISAKNESNQPNRNDLSFQSESFSPGNRDNVKIVEDKSEKSSSIAADPEKIPGLKWCCICHGDKFLRGDAGGYFCLECQPTERPGRVVLATVPRGEYVVD